MSSSLTAAGVNTPKSVNNSVIYSAGVKSMVRFKWSKVVLCAVCARERDLLLCGGLFKDLCDVIFGELSPGGSVCTPMLQSYVALRHISLMSRCVSGYILANL